jgi:hypothetical protein
VLCNCSSHSCTPISETENLRAPQQPLPLQQRKATKRLLSN